jgi:hypothetical protein
MTPHAHAKLLFTSLVAAALVFIVPAFKSSGIVGMCEACRKMYDANIDYIIGFSSKPSFMDIQLRFGDN